MFRPGTTRFDSPTSRSPTPSLFVTSPLPGRRLELAPSSGPGEKPKAVVTVQMPDGTVLHIQTETLTIEFEQDFQQSVSVSNYGPITYKVDRGTFTIRGKL